MLAIIKQQFHKMFACIGLFRLKAAGAKGAANLIVEIDSVCHKNDLWIKNIRMQGQRFCKHNHCQRFAAALSVPYNAAIPLFIRRRI